MSHLTETFVFKDLYKIRWARLGSEDSPKVILTHGTPFNSLIWLPFAEALKKDYCVYLWDLAGFGQSHELAHPVDEPDASWALQAELFTALYKHWGFSSAALPHVIAHDIGGHTVLRAYIIHGIRYSSLLLLDSVAITPWGSPFMRSVKSQPEVFLSIPPTMFRGMVRDYVQNAAHKPLKDDKMEDCVHPWVGRGLEGRKALIRQMAHADPVHTEEIEHHYSDIMARDGNEPKRLKIVWAENDTWVPLEQGRELCKRISPAEFVVVPEAGHLVMVDKPEVVMYEIATWLMKMII